MKKVFYLLNAIIILAAVTSCGSGETDPLDVPVVSIEDKTLTQRQLYDAVPHNMSKEDSAVFAQDYITRWVKTQLQLRKAELNLSEEEKNIDNLLEEYRTSLLTHQYQQKLLEEKYAPMITGSEIEAYYKSMNENFRLNEVIIKGIFIKLHQSSPNIQLMEQLFRSKKPADMLELETYCIQNAKKFDQFTENWTPISNIAREFPRQIANPGELFKTERYYTMQDLEYNYYLAIYEIMYEDEIAPLEFVSDRIKSILLNKKRVEFIEKLEEDLYDEGLKQKIVKFY